MQITDYIITLKDIHLYAYHGVMEQERKVGAWFTVELSLTITDTSCADTDCIENTVSYADVYDIVCREMAVPSNLLEHVSQRIIQSLLNTFQSISDIDITLTKETPPMGGDRLSAAVTMHAKR